MGYSDSRPTCTPVKSFNRQDFSQNNRVFYIPKTVGFGVLHNIASHILGLERLEVQLHRFYVSMPTISSNQVSVQALLQVKTSNGFCSIFRL